MHVALTGPIAGDDVRAYLRPGTAGVPKGYTGAPLTGILIGELLRLGHRVTAVTTDSDLPAAGGSMRLEGPNFSFVACPSRPRAWRPNGVSPGRVMDLFASERRLVSDAIGAAAPDIVHAHWSYEFALAALDLPLPHLITCHDSPAVVLRYTRSPYRALRWLMARRVFQNGREFSAVSDYLARELAPALGHLCQVIPNPVAAQVLALGRPRAAPVSRRVAMVCNGWDRRKNPEPALRAFALWRATEPTAELHVFGADFGPGETAQRWAEAELLASGVRFHGRLPHDRLVTALADMDALLHPALEESFGVVLAEAMALGLPVVAGESSGAVPWVLGAGTAVAVPPGVLIDVGSPQTMRDALNTVFDNNYAKRSAAGMVRARDRFSPASVIAEYLRRYIDVLRGQPAAKIATATQSMPLHH
jgi:glycosyltransferase involved in cell wall biosynthesis